MNCLEDKQSKQILFLTRMSARGFARFRTFLGRVCKACGKNSGCWIRPIKWRSEVVLIRKVRAQTVTFCKIQGADDSMRKSKKCQKNCSFFAIMAKKLQFFCYFSKSTKFPIRIPEQVNIKQDKVQSLEY